MTAHQLIEALRTMEGEMRVLVELGGDVAESDHVSTMAGPPPEMPAAILHAEGPQRGAEV